MVFIKKTFAIAFISLFLSSCGAYFNQPIQPQDARIGEVTPRTNFLKKLPVPQEPVVVGVYNFRDQTGQYKSLEGGSTFSTAVSQGATSMLVKSLEDSKWFTPIERENLNNLLNERNIIRTTREEYRKNNNPNEPALPPLLYAGVLLEGGIISYDSNIITGGLGARYFGVGGSTQYREDRITVYLRAVSTSNGKILKTVYVSKTILSQEVSASLFKYVNFQRLLEVETGFTKNEPVQLAMKDAIEKSVEALIIEGIEDKLWSTKEGEETNKSLVSEYNKEKQLEESTLLYDREQIPKDFRNTFSVLGSLPLLNGDYSKKRLGYSYGLGYSRQITNNLNISLEGSMLTLNSGKTYSKDFFEINLNAEILILPYEKFTPYVYGGGGYLFDLDERFNATPKIDPTLKFQGGVGLLYLLSNRMGIKAYAENNFAFSDKLDLASTGKRDDFYYNFGIGLNYYFGRPADVKILEPDNVKE
jgi:curli production assembly/transport component CsgG